MEMIILERDDGITHIALTGRLDTTGAERIDASFAEAMSARNQPAVVDLSEIEFLASRGIGLLFASGKRLKKAGHKLVLLGPKGMVNSVLKTSKVDKVMPIAYSLEEAIQILQGGPGTPVAEGPRPEPSGDESRTRQQEPATAASAAVGNVLKTAIKNEISELETLNATMAQFLDAHAVPYRASYAVNLAIEELVVNVIRYAYVDDDTHMIDVELVLEGDQIILRIVDDGRPFDPRRGPSLNLHAEDQDVGGLGLILVLDMVDTLKYRREEERNRVEVRIHLAAEDEDGELSEAVGDRAEAGGE